MLNDHDPTLQPRVTHLPSVEQLRRLRRGELDLGVFHHARKYADIETEPLFAGVPMVALLPRGHPLTAKEVLGHRELQDEVLISLSRADDPPLHDRILEAIESAGYRFRGVHEVGGADTCVLLPAIAQSMGIAFAPSSLAESSANGAGVARRLDPAPLMPQTARGLAHESAALATDGARHRARGCSRAGGAGRYRPSDDRYWTLWPTGPIVNQSGPRSMPRPGGLLSTTRRRAWLLAPASRS